MTPLLSFAFRRYVAVMSNRLKLRRMTLSQPVTAGFWALLATTAVLGPGGRLFAQESSSFSPDTLTLRPGDVVRVEIWREEELSGEFRVDEGGIVTLPLLGEKDVRGVPMREVRDRLIAEYRVQLRNPSITITPLRHVHVLGQVNQPGMYMIPPTMSLAGAVALAGGASSQGDLRRLRIARDGAIIQDGVRAEATLVQIDVRSGDQIFVERRGWFERNQNFLISTMLSVTALAISFLR